MQADTMRVEFGEEGCRLVIHGRQLYVFPIPDPEAFYDHVKAEIGPWLHERELARKTAPTALYVDDSGYDISSPKHPEYHSIHADLYDNREGK